MFLSFLLKTCFYSDYTDFAPTRLPHTSRISFFEIESKRRIPGLSLFGRISCPVALELMLGECLLFLLLLHYYLPVVTTAILCPPSYLIQVVCPLLSDYSDFASTLLPHTSRISFFENILSCGIGTDVGRMPALPPPPALLSPCCDYSDLAPTRLQVVCPFLRISCPVAMELMLGECLLFLLLLHYYVPVATLPTTAASGRAGDDAERGSAHAHEQGDSQLTVWLEQRRGHFRWAEPCCGIPYSPRLGVLDRFSSVNMKPKKVKIE
ncbi:uncharacterized protein [Hyperolius riggenbachi]|uniref:uncharacterized protein isoform X3 n=1 Tax=Hyperolius riggenbachi TaxID=752182 RepID=UPI0035A295CE